MIKYSLTKKEVIGHEGMMRVYATAQTEKSLNLEQLAAHIASHGSVYTRDVVSGVLTKLVDCVEEKLLEGFSIRLGEMGSYRLTISNVNYKKLPTEVAEFNPQTHISKVNVAWTRGKKFKNMKSQAQFSLTTTRKAQTAVLDAIKEGSETVDLSKKKD